MKMQVTLMIQKEIEGGNENLYQQKLKKIIKSLELQGWSVSVESEKDDIEEQNG
jgi:hypothetical protein